LDVRPEDIVVYGKADLFKSVGNSISGVTGDGINELIQLVSGRLQKMLNSAGVATRDRHRVAMLQAITFLDAATQMIENEIHDIVAEEIRSGIRAIDLIVGRIDVEDLLGEIFSSFCIGK